MGVGMAVLPLVAIAMLVAAAALVTRLVVSVGEDAGVGVGDGLNFTLLLAEGEVLWPMLIVYAFRLPSACVGGAGAAAVKAMAALLVMLLATLLVVTFLVVAFLVMLLVGIFVAPNPLVETPDFRLRFNRGAGTVVVVVVGPNFFLLASGPALCPALSTFLFLAASCSVPAILEEVRILCSPFFGGGEVPGKDRGENVGLWMASGLMKPL